MRRDSLRFGVSVFSLALAGFLLACAPGSAARSLAADDQATWSDQEKPIFERLRGLRMQ